MGYSEKVKVTMRLCRLDLNDPHTAVWGIWKKGQSGSVSRLDLNDPHTAVWGIEREVEGVKGRQDLNHPHTAVWGITKL